MAKLTKIILIDSLCKASKAMLSLDGNTTLTGTNGIGKTTFLKLIPIFYGIRPGDLITANSNQKSFADWYLPNSSSYIVFEYENWEGLPRCAVMHRSGSSYAYRLIRSEWKSELLYQDPASGVLAMPGELQKHLSQQGLDCTRELHPIHYNRIIQYNTLAGDMEEIEDAGMRSLVIGLRPTYTLAPRRKSFAGIDKLTVALIESKGTFDSMKSTMASILKQSSLNPSQMLKAITPQAFRSVLDSRAGYLAMEEMADNIRSLDEIYRAHKSATAQLARHKGWALSLLTEIRLRIEDVDQKLKENGQKAEDLELQANERRGVVGRKLSEARLAAEEADRVIANINGRRAQFEQHGIPALAELSALYPDMINERRQKQELLVQLDSKGADIRNTFEKHSQELRALKANEREGIRVRLAQALEDLQQLQQAVLERNKSAREELDSSQRSEQAILQEKRNTLTAEHAREELRLHSFKESEVPAHSQAELDAAQALIDQQQAVVDNLRESLSAAEEQERLMQIEAEGLAQRRKSLGQEQTKLHQQRDTLKKQLNAGSDTLIGFLRKHHPSWKSTVAKVTPVETLLRSDLSPQLSVEPGHSLYGVDIDLERLDTPLFADADALEAQITAISLQLETIETDLIELDKQGRQQDERRRKHNAEQAGRKLKLTQARSEMDSRRNAQTGIRERARAEQRQAIARQAELVRALDCQLGDLQVEKREMDSAHHRQAIELKTATDIELSDIRDDWNKLNTDNQVAMARIDEELACELQRIEGDLNARLLSEGIDNAHNRRMSEEIKALTSKILQCDNARSMIESFRLWQAQDLPRLPQLNIEAQTAQSHVDTLLREQSTLESEIAQQRATINANRKTLIAEAEQHNEELKCSNAILAQIASIAPANDEPLMPGTKAADLLEGVRKLLVQRRNFHDSGSSTYRTILNRFTRDPKGMLAHTPQGAAVEQIAARAGSTASDTTLAWTEAAEELMYFLQFKQPEQKTLLILQICNLSTELCNSRGQLEKLHKDILQLGRNATERAKEVIAAFPPIRQFEFKVTSKIHGMAFWDDLAEYERQYKRWQALGPETMPTDHFMTALRRIDEQVASGSFGTSLPDCFDVSVALNDQGSEKVATTNSALVHISSTGLTKIIVAMIYVSLFELLREDSDFQMAIPVDEALELSPENCIALIDYFNSRNISMLAGFPGGAPELLKRFKNCYTLKRKSEHHSITVTEYAPPTHDILDELNQQLSQDQQEEVVA
jgi:FtsZ-binding cell division protein ZapB